MQSRGNWWLGLIIVILGIILLLNNFNITQINLWPIIKDYWPLLLVFWGINIFWGKKEGSYYLSGGILLAFGLLLFCRNLGILDFNISLLWNAFWPLVLILLGISFIRGPKFQGKSNLAFMGGLEKTKTPWKLESGNYWALMGGIDLDLRQAEIDKGEYYLNCTAVMGGIDIIVPDDLSVFCEGTVILGGLNFLGKENGGIFASVTGEQASGNDETVIRIYGRSLMGGIEVKAKSK